MQQGGHRNRRAGIAAHGLEHDIRAHPALAQLLGYDKAKIGMGNDDGAAEQFCIGDAPHYLLEGRALPHQGHKLLGHALARDRPQSGTGASAHDDRDNLGSELRWHDEPKAVAVEADLM